MPEFTDTLTDRIAGASPGLLPLLRDAQAIWRERAEKAQADPVAGDGPQVGDGDVVVTADPGWRSFEDAFPTFYQFTNRPR